MDSTKKVADGLTVEDIGQYLSRLPLNLYRGSRILNVMVTHVPGVGVFFGFPITDANVHNNIALTKKLIEAHDAGPEKPSDLSKDDVYGCPDPSLPRDEGFFRCQILNQIGDVAEVCFIDYGNVAFVEVKYLFCIPQELQDFPITCKLFVIKGMEIVIGSTRSPPSAGRKAMRDWLEKRLLHQEVEIVPTMTKLQHEKGDSYFSDLKAHGVIVFLDGSSVLHDFKIEIIGSLAESMEMRRSGETGESTENSVNSKSSPESSSMEVTSSDPDTSCCSRMNSELSDVPFLASYGNGN